MVVSCVGASQGSLLILTNFDLIEDIVWSTASIDVIYSSITVCDYFRGVGRGFSGVSGNPLNF